MEGVASSAFRYSSASPLYMPKSINSTISIPTSRTAAAFSWPTHRFRTTSPQISPFLFSRFSSPNGGKVLLATSEVGVSRESTETNEWAMQDFYTLRKDVETVFGRVEEIRASAGLQLLEKNLADLEEASGDSTLSSADASGFDGC